MLIATTTHNVHMPHPFDNFDGLAGFGDRVATAIENMGIALRMEIHKAV